MPEHIRFILKHAAVGVGLGVAFVAMLLAFDVGGLWHLVTHTAEGPIAVLMLTVFCTITFGSAQIGYKIMSLGEENDDDDDDRGGKRDGAFTPDALTVPVRVDERRH
jgi:uncharacterized membrane protein